MGRFVVRRVGQMLVVLFAVSVLTFLIFNVMPGGDPALRMAGRQPDPGQLQRIREDWGFNEPIYVQYLKTMGQVFSGDMVSYSTQQNVWDELKGRIPRTFALAIGAAIMQRFVQGAGARTDFTRPAGEPALATIAWAACVAPWPAGTPQTA